MTIKGRLDRLEAKQAGSPTLPDGRRRLAEFVGAVRERTGTCAMAPTKGVSGRHLGETPAAYLRRICEELGTCD